MAPSRARFASIISRLVIVRSLCRRRCTCFQRPPLAAVLDAVLRIMIPPAAGPKPRLASSARKSVTSLLPVVRRTLPTPTVSPREKASRLEKAVLQARTTAREREKARGRTRIPARKVRRSRRTRLQRQLNLLPVMSKTKPRRRPGRRRKMEKARAREEETGNPLASKQPSPPPLSSGRDSLLRSLPSCHRRRRWLLLSARRQQ